MALILLKSSACLLAFIAFYKVFLERTSNHQFKRFYLLAIVIIQVTDRHGGLDGVLHCTDWMLAGAVRYTANFSATVGGLKKSPLIEPFKGIDMDYFTYLFCKIPRSK